jgi:hypothetical protein
MSSQFCNRLILGGLVVGTDVAVKASMNKPYYDKLDLQSIAHACDKVVSDARRVLGHNLGGGSVLDLVADNLDDVPLETLKTALVVAGISR